MTSFSLPAAFERGVGAGRGRLVDRVDEVDRRVLLQQVLHRRAAALLGAVGDVVADDPRVGLVADLRPCRRRRCRSPTGSPGRAGRRRRRRSGSGRASRSWPACPRPRTSPWPTARSGCRPGSCRWRRWRRRRPAGRSGVSSAIDEHARPAWPCPATGTIALESFARDHDALGARRRSGSRWPGPGPRCRRPACRRRTAAARPPARRPACAPSFIFTKNGLVSVLVIRPTIDLFARGGRRSRPSRWSPTTRRRRRRRARGRPTRPVAITAARRPPGEMGFRTGETSRLHRPGMQRWVGRRARGQR